jgi:hypothetical protein
MGRTTAAGRTSEGPGRRLEASRQAVVEERAEIEKPHRRVLAGQDLNPIPDQTRDCQGLTGLGKRLCGIAC